MASQRQIEANRRNSRKSCGPRTTAGRAKASRNALRHGLAARMSRQSISPDALETVARAMCGKDGDPQIFALAVKVAENEMVLQAIRVQQIAVVARLRQPHVMPFGKRNNGGKLADGKMVEAQLAHREARELTRKQIVERDEYEALEAAVVDLVRLDRYQRRAWSHQKKAVRELLRITIVSKTAQPKR